MFPEMSYAIFVPGKTFLKGIKDITNRYLSLVPYPRIVTTINLRP